MQDATPTADRAEVGERDLGQDLDDRVREWRSDLE
jgi:hypothetical protein